MSKDTKQTPENELTVKEVNVYSQSCGTTKLHCVIDCEVTHNCLITCDN